ncbi:MAG: MinD/ParA family protein [Myxococcota bacterium]
MSAAERFDARGAGVALPNGLAVLSGKGGVGKTNLVANLAVAAGALGGRVLVVDGDLGLANVDVLLGLTPHLDLERLEGRPLADAIVEGPRGIHVLPASSGSARLAALGPRDHARLVEALSALAPRYDLALVDCGPGIGATALGFATACARAWVVTNAEPTSLADAYATVKVLAQARPAPRTELLVNDAASDREARETHAQLERMALRFLGVELGFAGAVPRDARLAEAVARQRAVVELHPSAPSSRRLIDRAHALLVAARAPARAAAAPPPPPA